MRQISRRVRSRRIVAVAGLLGCFLIGIAATFLCLRLQPNPPMRVASARAPIPAVIAASNSNGASDSNVAIAQLEPRVRLSQQVAAPMPKSSPNIQTMPGVGNALQIPAQLKPPLSNQHSTIELSSRVDQNLSRTTTNYLHGNRLPYVDALVSVDPSAGATVLVLSGQVRTAFGHQDAEQKARDFLKAANLQVVNRIQIDAQLASRSIAVANQTQEIALPPVFYGCWRGTSLHSDLSQYLGGCGPGYDVPVTEELCFRRAGDAQYEITFQSAASALPNFQQHTSLTSSDGANHLTLKDHGSYNIRGLLSSSAIMYDEDSQCELIAGKLLCRNTSLFHCDGAPWYRQAGHIAMNRIN